MKTTITFGRGKFTKTTRIVNQKYDATQSVSLILVLDDGTTACEDWCYDSRYHVNAKKVTLEQFQNWCKAKKIDWDLLCLLAEEKESSRAQDPMGTLADYE